MTATKQKRDRRCWENGKWGKEKVGEDWSQGEGRTRRLLLLGRSGDVQRGSRDQAVKCCWLFSPLSLKANKQQSVGQANGETAGEYIPSPKRVLYFLHCALQVLPPLVQWRRCTSFFSTELSGSTHHREREREAFAEVPSERLPGAKMANILSHLHNRWQWKANFELVARSWLSCRIS